MRLPGFIPLLAFVSSAASPDCIRIDGDRILASHLTAVAPALSGVPAETAIGFAPKLGVVRWLAPEQLQGFAARHGARVEIGAPVCVERVGRNLDPAEITAALSAALQRAGHVGFSLNVLDYPRAPQPRGELQFSMTGLRPPPSGRRETYWRGRLQVEGGQTVPIVVRVEVSVEVAELRAAHDIAPGQTIAAEDLLPGTRQAPPGVPSTMASLADAVGRQSRRVIKAGSVIQPHMLTSPPEIQRGDRVLVAASSGQAAIGVETKAETAARVGQSVVLTNPASGKKFKATVTGRGRAAVHLDKPQDKPNDDTDPH